MQHTNDETKECKCETGFNGQIASTANCLIHQMSASTPLETGGWESKIYKLIEFNNSMSKKENDALVYLLVDKLIPEIIRQNTEQAARKTLNDIYAMVNTTPPCLIGCDNIEEYARSKGIALITNQDK